MSYHRIANYGEPEYGSDYSTIDLNKFPGSMRLPGKTLKQQAKDADYSDLYRDMQVMRNEEYAKEVKRGQFVPEFGDLPTIGILLEYKWALLALVIIGLWIRKCGCFN